MKILLEQISDGYRASSLGSLEESVQGTTREEAIDRLREVLTRRLGEDAEIVSLDIPGEQRLRNDPWLRMFGIFKDDSAFEEWQATIQENRRRENEAEGIFPERNA